MTTPTITAAMPPVQIFSAGSLPAPAPVSPPPLSPIQDDIVLPAVDTAHMAMPGNLVIQGLWRAPAVMEDEVFLPVPTANQDYIEPTTHEAYSLITPRTMDEVAETLLQKVARGETLGALDVLNLVNLFDESPVTPEQRDQRQRAVDFFLALDLEKYPRVLQAITRTLVGVAKNPSYPPDTRRRVVNGLALQFYSADKAGLQSDILAAFKTIAADERILETELRVAALQSFYSVQASVDEKSAMQESVPLFASAACSANARLAEHAELELWRFVDALVVTRSKIPLETENPKAKAKVLSSIREVLQVRSAQFGSEYSYVLSECECLRNYDAPSELRVEAARTVSINGEFLKGILGLSRTVLVKRLIEGSWVHVEVASALMPLLPSEDESLSA